MHRTSPKVKKAVKGRTANVADAVGHSPGKVGISSTKQKHKTVVKDAHQSKDETAPTKDFSEQGDSLEPTEEQVEAEVQRLLKAELHLPSQVLSQVYYWSLP